MLRRNGMKFRTIIKSKSNLRGSSPPAANCARTNTRVSRVPAYKPFNTTETSTPAPDELAELLLQNYAQPRYSFTVQGFTPKAMAIA